MELLTAFVILSKPFFFSKSKHFSIKFLFSRKSMIISYRSNTARVKSFAPLSFLAFK
jgi:hypothetical protein